MPSARFSFYRSVGILILAFFSACATAPKRGEFADRDLLSAACPAGFTKKLSGSVWMKIESKEMSGQFPASVLVDYPTKFTVEVTNLIGSPQAWLTIENGKTELKFTPENEKQYGRAPRAREVLGGLPIELAPRLFSGGVPCPSDDKNQDIRVKQTDEGGLEVTAVDLRTRISTRYVYSYTKVAGQPWVAEADYEKLARGAKPGAKSNLIKIIREEPSDPDSAPKRWSASSSHGEIKVRWKDRTVTPAEAPTH
jgi:hypothetical protein